MDQRRMSISPRDVLRLKAPTNGFLCSVSDNIYGIQFLSFVISDDESKNVLFEISQDTQLGGKMEIDNESYSGDDCCRAIKYTFSEKVLRLQLVATRLIFKVGEVAIPNFRMIERHYFKNELIKSYDFTFGFCIPGSVNTWEAIYDVPPLKEHLIQEMIANPYSTKSDTFYFVGNDLIIHNKARYQYVKEDIGAQTSFVRRNSLYSEEDSGIEKMTTLSLMESGITSQMKLPKNN